MSNSEFGKKYKKITKIQKQARIHIKNIIQNFPGNDKNVGYKNIINNILLSSERLTRNISVHLRFFTLVY